MCLRVLEGLGVTAVLNAAQGEMTDWNYVNTKASYYAGKGIRQGFSSVSVRGCVNSTFWHSRNPVTNNFALCGYWVRLHVPPPD